VEGATSRAMVASGLKLFLSPRNYGWFFVSSLDSTGTYSHLWSSVQEIGFTVTTSTSSDDLWLRDTNINVDM
jgi:hypothetical protein